jgi:hypothetical protein
MKLVKCTCGWIHTANTIEQLGTNAFDHLKCFSCGRSYTEMKVCNSNEVPPSVTLQAILDPDYLPEAEIIPFKKESA